MYRVYTAIADDEGFLATRLLGPNTPTLSARSMRTLLNIPAAVCKSSPLFDRQEPKFEGTVSPNIIQE